MGPRPQQALELTWSATGQSARLALQAPVDLTGRRLDLRSVVDQRRAGLALGARLVDADGRSVPVALAGGGRLDRLPGGARTGKWWAQDLVLDPAGVTGVDLTRVVAVELTGRSARGHVVLLDASVTAPGLAAVPARRAPLVNLGSVRRREGNSRTPVTVRMPLALSGPVTQPLRVRYRTTGLDGRPRRGVVTVPVGATRASVPVTYQPDRSYGGSQLLSVETHVDSGASTDGWSATLEVVEDDPAPRFSVEPARRRVVEGQDAVVRLGLSRPMTHDTYVTVRFATAPRPRASAGDLPARVFDTPQQASTALHRTHQWFYVRVPAGRRKVAFRLPTARDRVREPEEQLALKVRLDLAERSKVRTVRFTLADR